MHLVTASVVQAERDAMESGKSLPASSAAEAALREHFSGEEGDKAVQQQVCCQSQYRPPLERLIAVLNVANSTLLQQQSLTEHVCVRSPCIPAHQDAPAAEQSVAGTRTSGQMHAHLLICEDACCMWKHGRLMLAMLTQVEESGSIVVVEDPSLRQTSPMLVMISQFTGLVKLGRDLILSERETA